MKKMVIVIDLDEVLFPMVDTFLGYYNELHGTSIDRNQMQSYYLQDLTGEPEEAIFAKLQAFLLTPHHQDALPVEGSMDGIKRLSEKYELVLLTARQSFFRGYTEQFIHKHYPGLFDAVRYTHRQDEPDVEIPKAEICKSVNAIAIIDDSLKNVAKCAEQGIEGILFGDYAWNRANKLPLNVIRLNNWQEVAEHFGV